MPSPFVKSLAKTSGKSEAEIEKFWKKAKEITSDTFNKKEADFGDKEYAYTTGIVKQMLGMKEEVLDPTTFLESDLTAKEYIEAVTSSAFPSLDKHLIPPEDEDTDEADREAKNKKDKKEPTNEDVDDENWGLMLDRMMEKI